MLPETLGELLNITMIVGLITALVLDKWPWFLTQEPGFKLNFVKGIALAAGVLISAINLFVPESALANVNTWYELAQPLLNMLLYSFVGTSGAFGASQLTHVVYRALHKAGDNESA